MSTVTVRTRVRRYVILGAVAALAIAMVVAAAPAGAAVACAVSGVSPNQTMTVTLDADADAVTIAVDGATIEWNGNPCTPAANTADVSAIAVTADTLAQVEAQAVTIEAAGPSPPRSRSTSATGRTP